jgi:GT2 family glycosyltransferase
VGGRTAAIVLHYRTPDRTSRALRALAASDPPPDDLLLVDNDSDHAASPASALASGLPASVVRAGGNLGFSGGMNVGIREALRLGASHVLLVNSDAVVARDCLARLHAGLAATPGAGIAGPTLLMPGSPARVESRGIAWRPATGRMRLHGHGRVAGPAGGAVERVDAVSGCVMLIAAAVFQSAGLFDDDYFWGFEDLDFCLRARRAGFASVVVPAATAEHEGSHTIGASSPRRLYYASRNHLLLAHRSDPDAGRVRSVCRAAAIVALNAAHAARHPRSGLGRRLAAVARGAADFVRGRVGAAP